MGTGRVFCVMIAFSTILEYSRSRGKYMNKTIIWMIGIFTGYSLVVYALLYMLNFFHPAWIERIISILAMPIFLLIAPWMDSFRNLGLTEGEWVVMPTFTGYLLIIFLYAVALYILLLAIGWTIRCYFYE